MTREEAIQEVNKAFEPAFANYIVKALTEGATTSDKCDDAVSRQAVLDKIKEVCFSREQKWVDFRVSQGSNGQRDFLINYIEQLPPVTPTRKEGRWIDTKEISTNRRGQIVHEVICSECNGISYFRGMDGKYIGANLCPNCGAEMERGVEK